MSTLPADPGPGDAESCSDSQASGASPAGALPSEREQDLFEGLFGVLLLFPGSPEETERAVLPSRARHALVAGDRYTAVLRDGGRDGDEDPEAAGLSMLTGRPVLVLGVFDGQPSLRVRRRGRLRLHHDWALQEPATAYGADPEQDMEFEGYDEREPERADPAGFATLLGVDEQVARGLLTDDQSLEHLLEALTRELGLPQDLAGLLALSGMAFAGEVPSLADFPDVAGHVERARRRVLSRTDCRVLEPRGTVAAWRAEVRMQTHPDEAATGWEARYWRWHHARPLSYRAMNAGCALLQGAGAAWLWPQQPGALVSTWSGGGALLLAVGAVWSLVYTLPPRRPTS